MEQVKLNDLPLDAYGAVLLKGGYAELLKPAEEVGTNLEL